MSIDERHWLHSANTEKGQFQNCNCTVTRKFLKSKDAIGRKHKNVKNQFKSDTGVSEKNVKVQQRILEKALDTASTRENIETLLSKTIRVCV